MDAVYQTTAYALEMAVEDLASLTEIRSFAMSDCGYSPPEATALAQRVVKKLVDDGYAMYCLDCLPRSTPTHREYVVLQAGIGHAMCNDPTQWEGTDGSKLSMFATERGKEHYYQSGMEFRERP